MSKENATKLAYEDFCAARYRHGKIFGTTLAGLELDSWILSMDQMV